MFRMPICLWCVLVSCTIALRSYSQTGSEHMYIIASAKIGVYLSHSDFLHNDPIPIHRIKFGDGFADIKHIYSLKKSDVLVYHDRYGLKKQAPASEIWGYCTGDNIFVSAGLGFSKLEIVGSISYFIADVLVEQPEPMAPMSGSGATFGAQPRYSYERQAVLVDLRTGKMLESSPRNLESMIQADSSLYTLYSGLKSKEQQKQLIQIITDYNLRHPFIFAQ